MTGPQKGRDRTKLEIDSVAVPVVRFLCTTKGYEGAPIGIARPAALLNERGERLGGKPFHVSDLCAILTTPVISAESCRINATRQGCVRLLVDKAEVAKSGSGSPVRVSAKPNSPPAPRRS